MLKEENVDGGGVGENSWGRVCQTCCSAAGMVYCHRDSTYLCTSCVASRHERVTVCESCQRAPAAFLCKADAASLCTTCDAEIHSANPLVRRHQRVPILPMGSLCGPTAVKDQEEGDEEDEDEAASWLLFNPVKDDNNNNYNKNQNSRFSFGGEANKYLDLVEYNSSMENQFPDQYSKPLQDYSVPEKSSGSDSVVPCRNRESGALLQEQNFQLGIDYSSTRTQHNYRCSMNHNVPIPSLDIGVVPETTAGIVPAAHTARPSIGAIELYSGQMVTQLSPMDREARVLRYREKKKTRRFEKTIRYASRKAYAEKRPRIKGRFVKRKDVEAEMNQVFYTTLLSGTSCGIVPSF